MKRISYAVLHYETGKWVVSTYDKDATLIESMDYDFRYSAISWFVSRDMKMKNWFYPDSTKRSQLYRAEVWK